jgi:hypothetical protein
MPASTDIMVDNSYAHVPSDNTNQIHASA